MNKASPLRYRRIKSLFHLLEFLITKCRQKRETFNVVLKLTSDSDLGTNLLLINKRVGFLCYLGHVV